MHCLSRIPTLLALALLATLATQRAASGNQDLEAGLINALRLKRGTTERVGDSGKAIQAYMRKGLVRRRPDQRAGYTDYYLLNKPAKFMGHELVVIEEEYKTRHLGCCVDPGVGVSIRAVGSTKNLKEFAEANECMFTDPVNLQYELGKIYININLPPGHFASLSCRERGAVREH